MNKKQLLRAAIFGIPIVVAFVFFLPSIFMRPTVHNWIVHELLFKQGVDAEISSISLGWFRPTRLEGVSIGPVGQPTVLSAARVSSDRTLWNAWREGVALGELTIERPEVHIWIGEDGRSNLQFERMDDELTEPRSTEDTSPHSQSLSIFVRDAALFIKTPTMPAEANVFQGLDLRGDLRKVEGRRLLLIHPDRVLDRAEISPELCQGGLKYLLPILAEATWTRGEVSMDLDACLIDLDDPKSSLISGKLHVHGIEAGIKNELLANATRLLAVRLGKDGLDTVHLADNSVVHFQVRDGQVWHEGVEFGLPRISEDLVVRTSGSVAFDETLDLTIQIPMPLHLVADGPLAKALTDKALTLQARGTLATPEVKVTDDDFIGKLIARAGGDLPDEEHPVQGILADLREVLSTAAGEAGNSEDARPATPILDRLLERRGDRSRPLRRLFGDDDKSE